MWTQGQHVLPQHTVSFNPLATKLVHKSYADIITEVFQSMLGYGVTGIRNQCICFMYNSSCKRLKSRNSPHEFHVKGNKLRRWLDVVLMNVCDMLGETQIVLTVRLVLDKPQQVKPEEETEVI